MYINMLSPFPSAPASPRPTRTSAHPLPIGSCLLSLDQNLCSPLPIGSPLKFTNPWSNSRSARYVAVLLRGVRAVEGSERHRVKYLDTTRGHSARAGVQFTVMEILRIERALSDDKLAVLAVSAVHSDRETPSLNARPHLWRAMDGPAVRGKGGTAELHVKLDTHIQYYWLMCSI